MRATTLISATFLLVAGALISTNYAFSQVDGVYFRTTIEIRDSQNNTDTVIFVVKEGSTHGIDTELGEINLYGQEPSKVLEARIIQRTDSNFEVGGKPYWLQGMAAASSNENIDLKVDYRAYDTIHLGHNVHVLRLRSFVLKVYAQHYPVSIHLINIGGIYESCLQCLQFTWIKFNEENGIRIGGSQYADFPIPPFHLYTFNEEADNNLIWIRQEQHVSVGDDLYSHQPLYPNPSKNYVVIANGRFGERFEITDVEGRLIQSFTVESYPYRLDITKLTKSTYFLKNSDGTVIHKFIKE